MFKIWNSLQDNLKAKFLTLSVIALTLPALSNAQEVNAEQSATTPQDSTKNLPSWTMEMDSIQSAKPDTARFTDFIDDAMVERGYATDLSNGFTKIAALELLRNGNRIGKESLYSPFMEAANNDEKTAVKNLRLRVLDDENFRKEAYEDLMAIHHIYLNHNGASKEFNADLSKGDASKIKESWESKTTLDNYLPANLILKQLGNADNISNLLNDDKLTAGTLDGDNLLGTMSTHIGPTGTKKLLDLVNDGHGNDKLNNHYNQDWVDVLVDKCAGVPYGHIIGEEGIKDLKENLTVDGFFNLLTLYHLTEQNVPLDVPVPEEEKEEYGDALKMISYSSALNIHYIKEEKTTISVGVSPFVEMDSRYTFNKDDYFLARDGNDNFTRRNTAFAGVEWRLANFAKENETGKESTISLSGTAAIGYGATNINYAMSSTAKQDAANYYGVQTDFFDNFQDMTANHLVTRLSARLNIGPAFVDVAQSNYHTLGTDNMNTTEKYLAHNVNFIDYMAGINLLQLETGKGDIDVSVSGGFTDTNAGIRNKGELSQDGSSSQSQQNQYLVNNPQAVLEHFKAGTLPRMHASQNKYNIDVHFTPKNSRVEIFAGYSRTSDNAHGGAGLNPMVKDWVNDALKWQEGRGQFNAGISVNLGKKTQKRSESYRTFQREYSEINGKDISVSSKYTTTPTKVEESTEKAPANAHKRRLFHINLKSLFGGGKKKAESQPAPQSAGSKPIYLYN